MMKKTKNVKLSNQTSAQPFRNEFDKLKKLFFKPTLFFEGVASETKYLQPLLYFVVILLISQIINFILTLPSIIKQPMVFFFLIASLFSISIAVGIGMIVPFISAAINHIGVLMFGGKNGYYNTFKPTTYAMIIGVFYGLIILIINFIMSLINPITIPSTPPSSITEALSFIPLSYLIVNGVIYAVSLIHTLIVEVEGIAFCHKISKTRAFLAVIVMMLIMMVIATLAFIMIMKFLPTITLASPQQA